MKMRFKTCLKVLLVLAAAITAGTVLMMAVYLLPVGAIKENAADSADIFAAEGNYPKLIQRRFNTTLDNWTDATILAEAAYDGEENAAVKAMLNFHEEVTGENQAESFVRIYSGEEGLNIQKAEYGRYWHGYLLFIKPLLMVMNYGGLRELMAFVQLMLFAILEYELIRRKKGIYAVPTAFVYALLNPAAVSMTINYAIMFFLIFAELIFIVRHDGIYRERGNWVVHFAVVGCMTSFFDYLTYPLAGFGLAMLLLLALYPDKPAEDLIQTVKSGAAWIFGYVGMWGSKWIIGTCISGVNIIENARDTVAMRSGGDVGEGFSRLALSFNAIYKNLSAGRLVLGITLLAVLGCLVRACVRKTRPDIRRLLLLCAFMAAPLLWYAFAANHSYIQYFFTYRTLSVSVFAALMFGFELAGLNGGAAPLQPETED